MKVHEEEDQNYKTFGQYDQNFLAERKSSFKNNLEDNIFFGNAQVNLESDSVLDFPFEI